MSRRVVGGVAVAVLLLAVAACGGGEGSAFEEASTTSAESTSTTDLPTTTALASTTTSASTTSAAVSTTATGAGSTVFGGMVADALTEGAGAESGVLTGNEEACVGAGLTQAIGEQRLAELDALTAGTDDITVVFAQMTDPELDALVGVISTCIDVEALLTAEMSGDLSPEATACLAGSLSQEGTLNSLVRVMMAGADPATNPEFMAIMVPIMSEDCAEPLQAMLVDELVASGISEEGAACIADRFMSGGLFAAVIDSLVTGAEFGEDPELAAEMMAVFTGCLTPEELGDLGG